MAQVSQLWKCRAGHSLIITVDEEAEIKEIFCGTCNLSPTMKESKMVKEEGS